MGRFVINVREFEDGMSDHLFEIPVDWVLGTLEGCQGIAAGHEPGAAELTVTKNGRELLIRGSARAPLSVSCVRCLEDFRLDVEAEIEVLMLPGAVNPSECENEDDLGVERYQGDLIVLDELIRDSLILEVPMNPNCGDDCPGWDHLGTTPTEAS